MTNKFSFPRALSNGSTRFAALRFHGDWGGIKPARLVILGSCILDLLASEASNNNLGWTDRVGSRT